MHLLLNKRILSALIFCCTASCTAFFRLRLFNNKCINSKNKAKGFWEMLRDNKANVTPSQIIDPVDKTKVFLRDCQTVLICHGNVLVY
jgi:hypothetical protein